MPRPSCGRCSSRGRDDVRPRRRPCFTQTTERPMSSRTRTLHAALAALVTACAAAHQPPLPIAGAAGDMAALAGQWEGSYSSASTGRSGSISFTLSAGNDSAFGDVIMIPRGWGRPLQAWNGQASAGTDARPRSAVLTISFVRVIGGRVTGTLAPYADPETGAQPSTTFKGRLDRDTSAGTYSTRGAGPGGPPTGQWTAPPRRG